MSPLTTIVTVDGEIEISHHDQTTTIHPYAARPLGLQRLAQADLALTQQARNHSARLKEKNA